MGFFRKFVLHNAGLKLLALAISFSLWVAYAQEPIAEGGYDVPITIVEVPRGLAVASDAPSAVHLLIRGRAARLRRVAPGDLAFTVDLSQVSRGETTVRLTPEMAAVPYGTEVVGVTPTIFRVSWAAEPGPPPR